MEFWAFGHDENRDEEPRSLLVNEWSGPRAVLQPSRYHSPTAVTVRDEGEDGEGGRGRVESRGEDEGESGRRDGEGRAEREAERVEGRGRGDRERERG